jgi:hypothetical protein
VDLSVGRDFMPDLKASFARSLALFPEDIKPSGRIAGVTDRIPLADVRECRGP